MTIRILVVDDHRIVCEGLVSLINGCPDYTVAGQVESGRAAITFTRRHRPDIVIMDISMPDLNGIDATRLCIEAFPPVKVIALSMHSDRRYVMGMLKAGARGYILKESVFQELLQAIEAACNDQVYLSPKVAGTVVHDLIRKEPPRIPCPADTLTVKEREVLQMIAEGRATRQMARVLNVSVKTVEARRKSIMNKLGLHTIAGLTKYAIREGLTTLQ